MRAIAFTRVSTSKQDEGVRQIQQIKKYCAVKGYQLLENKTISEIISGKADDRAGLIKLTQLSKDDADIIIISESSRITRRDENDYLDLVLIVQAIQKTGLDLYILGSSQTYKADKKLSLVDVITLVIEAERNSKERETILVRTKTGKDKKLANNGYIGHIMPFGYRVNEANKCYFEINEVEAVIVRLMFDLVANQGYSVNQVGKYLMRTQGCKWHTTSVSRMLKNRAYMGEFTIMDKLINVPAIVTAELFEQVQYKMKENHLYISKGNKNFSPLKGVLRCACGKKMFTYTSAKNGTSYKCSSKNTAALEVHSCGNGGIQTETLNKIVWNITKKFINVDDFKAKTEQQKKIINDEIKAIEKNVSALMTEKNELAVKIESLVDNIIDADKSIQSVLNKRLSKLVAVGSGIDKEIEKLNIEVSKVKNRLKDLSVELLPSLVSEVSNEEKHEIFTKYIAEVSYHNVTKYKGFITIMFNNKVETIVMCSTRPIIKAYALPLSFYFNPINRTVTNITEFESKEKKMLYKIFESDDKGDNRTLKLLASASTTELTFKEMEQNKDTQQYLMNL